MNDSTTESPGATAIVTLVRGEPLLSTDDIQVSRPSKAIQAMQAVIERAQAITGVSDAQSQSRAALVCKELQGMRQGLKTNFNAAKSPILAAGRALDDLYRELDAPMAEQYDRLSALHAGYRAELTRQHELAEVKAKAEQRVAEAKAEAKIRELERQKQELELRLRLSEETAEKRRLTKQVDNAATQIEAQKIALEVEKELPVGAPLPPVPKGPGRNWIEYEVRMTSAKLLMQDHEELVESKLRIAAAKALAKSLDEQGKPLVVPGLEIRKIPRSSFTGAAAIRIHGE